jgi:class 3 adenylate cyclase/CHASE2 domain-containing sensor protein
VKFKPTQRAPWFIAAAVIALACLAQWLRFGPLEQLEARSYDWRVRLAQKFPAPAATNLGFVAISDDTITRLKDGSLGFHYGLYWPRHVYGQVLRELTAQGATVVGFDILFPEARTDHSPVTFNTNVTPSLKDFADGLHPNANDKHKPLILDDKITVESDDFFAWQLHESQRGLIAAEQGALPLKNFRAQTTVAHISAERDADGVLRRARAFQDFRVWHPLFEQAASEYGFDLAAAKIEPRQITFLNSDKQEIKVPLDANGTFDPVDFGGAAAAGLPRARPFSETRVWHMGLALAARALGADLSLTKADLFAGRVSLVSSNHVVREIPVDADGYFYVNWEIPIGDPRLHIGAFEKLLAQDLARTHGDTNELVNDWRGQIVIIGSTATGNDLTDLGATPLAKSTCLVSKHWNVANAILQNRFITRPPLAADCALIVLLGALTAFFTWRLRAFTALVAVVTLAVGYTLVTVMLYNQSRVWLPLVLPLGGALLMQHLCLVTWRVVFEQAEKRRVRNVFSKVVAPEIVHELLDQKKLSLGGARREITVFFADVRGFTAFTDLNREDATEFIRKNNFTGERAEAIYDEQAREALNTVNVYLALVADTIKQHSGTLDKYIGDCVMAFWGAPAAHPRHALNCVRAAINAQRAIDELNRARADENTKRELQNFQRAAAGEMPLPALPILSLGTGINTGPALVGLMGSDKHGLNYTVFGREINLASRLEALSGRGRIFIGEATFLALQRDDPALAATCTAHAPVTVKGIRESVKMFEVPWRLPGTISPIGDDYGSASSGHDTSSTGFIRLG